MYNMELKEIFKKIPVSQENIDKYCQYIQRIMPVYGIDTPLRQRHFIAQILHESANLTAVRENLNYSAEALVRVFPKYFNVALAAQYARRPEKIANRVYANRLGNGDESSGDGYRYIGRGLIQTTGKTNYTATSQHIFGDNRLLKQPELLEEPNNAVASACYYWKSNNLNNFADKDDIVSITKRINGGINGLEDRKKYYNILKNTGL